MGLHDLIIHNYGPGRQFASVHVEVPQDTDFVKCHEQVDLCEKLVNEKYNISLVIHMDPIDVNNEAVTKTRAEIESIVKSIDSRMTIHDFRMTPSGEKRTNLIFDAVVPAGLAFTKAELEGLICEKAVRLNPTYNCVITFDDDFTVEE